MTERMRGAVGLLAIGLALGVVSLAGFSAEDGTAISQALTVLRITGALFFVGGLALAATELLRPSA